MRSVPVEPAAGRRARAVPSSGFRVPSPQSRALTPASPATGDASDSGWTLIDCQTYHRLIPAGERLAVKFDSATESLLDTLLPERLTDPARRAVSVAPTWLQDDLADNFRRLSPVTQDVYANLILNCPDKRYYDELCFQVAHLAPEAFMSLRSELLVDNVQLAYQIDPELQYVEIVDYGDPLQGGDYYSLTRYRAIVNGETTLVEIPRDIYYWWIIMPKGTDEQPTYVYDYFWREYLYYCCDSGYPLLREKLANTQVVWNGERAWWAGNGAPFYDTLPAVAVVGRWVSWTMPDAAQGNRPIQPNQIAHEHNGNCGEVQDLLWAAARTALIPCGGVCDINEDHVWCEIWWQGEFHPWQVDLGGGPVNIRNPGIAYDRKYGGGKSVSGVWDWRNDGRQRSVVGTYSDVCTLTVEVRDSTRRLLDGALVRISSEDWYGGMADCFYGVTDRTGRYTTTLGDWQNYQLQIVSPLGTHQGGRIIDSADCVPGTHFFYACTLAHALDSLSVELDSGPPLNRYRLDVTYDASHEALYGHDCYNANGSNTYAWVQAPGAIDFFLTDQPGFDRYLAGESFAAFANDENTGTANHSLVLSRTGNHYAVLSNEEQANLTAFVDVTVKLYERSAGIALDRGRRAGDDRQVTAFPNPFSDKVSIRLPPVTDRFERTVGIYDPTGRLVRTFQRPHSPRSAHCPLVWDGTDQSGRKVAPGVYFCQVRVLGQTLNRLIVFSGAGR